MPQESLAEIATVCLSVCAMTLPVAASCSLAVVGRKPWRWTFFAAVVFGITLAAEGFIDGHLRRKEFVRAYQPKLVGGMKSTAIAWTTAGSVAAVIEMVRKGSLPRNGLLRQEDIPFDAFVATPTGRLFAE